MRELASTGFMSNRGRQNVASLLAKDLNQDWRQGELGYSDQMVQPCSYYQLVMHCLYEHKKRVMTILESEKCWVFYSFWWILLRGFSRLEGQELSKVQMIILVMLVGCGGMLTTYPTTAAASYLQFGATVRINSASA